MKCNTELKWVNITSYIKSTRFFESTRFASDEKIKEAITPQLWFSSWRLANNNTLSGFVVLNGHGTWKLVSDKEKS